MASGQTFEDYYLKTKSFDAFHEMKFKGEFCDITIKFGNHAISAHRNIVAAGIPYFRDKLPNQNNETDLNGVIDCNLDADALESLIEFSYTSKIHLTAENVRAILPTASFLRIDSVTDACCKFIVEQLKPEDVLSVRQYAENVNSSKLLESIDHYVCNHFDQVSANEIFLDAPFCYVKELICRDNLRASKEEKVLDFAIKWVKKSPDEREIYLAELLSKVRMALVHPVYLTDCCKEDMIMRSIPCRNILEDARTYHFLPHRRAMISNFETSARGNVKQRPKGNEIWPPGIYAVCSLPEESYYYDTDPIPPPKQSLQYFDPVTKQWSVIDVLSFSLHSVSSSLVQCNGKLYLYDSDYIRAYDPPTQGSSNSSFYVGQRFNAGITVSKNKLYICGGTTANELYPLNTVVSFDFQTNCRIIIKDMPFRGTHLGAATLNDDLYVLGGKNEYGQILNSVWKRDGRSRRWVAVTPMKYARCAMGCAVLDGKIYVCAGMSNTNVTLTAEVFDPLVNQWVLLPQMNISLFGVSSFSYERKLYIVGGKSSSEGFTYKKVWFYDPIAAKWNMCSNDPKPFEFVKATSVENTIT